MRTGTIRALALGLGTIAVAVAAIAPAVAAPKPPPAQSITIVSPASGAFVGSLATITWTSTGFSPGDELEVKVSGATVAVVAVATGTFDWHPTTEGPVLLRLQSASIKSAEITLTADKTAPTITVASRTPANPNGWNNGDVTVVWSCTDEVSGAVAATDTTTLTQEGTDLAVTGTCTDAVGNSATDTVTGINIDTSAPTITLESQTPANPNGWNNGDVTVVWSCTDGVSGAVAATDTTTLTQEGTDLAATGTCTDKAGNDATATVTGIDIDRTGATATVDDPALGVAIGTVSGTADDALSGVASVAVTFVDVLTGTAVARTATCIDQCATWVVLDGPKGAHYVKAVATDLAGNSGTPSSERLLVVI